MFRGRQIAVVVPAFNEADKIAHTIASMPPFVDAVIVVDDASHDGTGQLARTCARPGLHVIVHPHNRGVGAAIATGYAQAASLGADVTAVMAGDAQMDPADLEALVAAVVDGGADYAKGNRFAWPGGVLGVMPFGRVVGNVVLSYLTRVATGHRTLFDSQCGYTAANRRALAAIAAGPLFPRYGYPNDVLARLAAEGLTVRDVPVRPVYGPAWRSGLRPHRVALPILRLLARAAKRRLARAIERRRPVDAPALAPVLLDEPPR
jgi:glycosyltransferase involved in cell wall biosynthesis